MVERLVANEKVVGSSPIARSILSIMSDLAEKKCIPCEGGIPSFKIDEIHKYLKKVDGWDVKPDESKNYYLIKEFKFKNFLITNMERAMGLEPTTFSLATRRSTTELCPPV